MCAIGALRGGRSGLGALWRRFAGANRRGRGGRGTWLWRVRCVGLSSGEGPRRRLPGARRRGRSAICSDLGGIMDGSLVRARTARLLNPGMRNVR